MVTKANIEIFTTPTCPHCPIALKLVKDVVSGMDGDISIVETNMTTPLGRKRASDYKIMSVPTIFVSGSGYNQKVGFAGTPPRESLIKGIEIALGIREWEDPSKKEGIFSKLFKKFNFKI